MGTSSLLAPLLPPQWCQRCHRAVPAAEGMSETLPSHGVRGDPVLPAVLALPPLSLSPSSPPRRCQAA